MTIEPQKELPPDEDIVDGIHWAIDINPKASAVHAIQFKGTPLDGGDVRWQRQNYPPVSKKMQLAMELKLAKGVSQEEIEGLAKVA